MTPSFYKHIVELRREYPGEYCFLTSCGAAFLNPALIAYLIVLKEIEQFFSVYKTLEGKLSLTFGWSGKAEASKRIEACRFNGS